MTVWRTARPGRQLSLDATASGHHWIAGSSPAMTGGAARVGSSWLAACRALVDVAEGRARARQRALRQAAGEGRQAGERGGPEELATQGRVGFAGRGRRRGLEEAGEAALEGGGLVFL